MNYKEMMMPAIILVIILAVLSLGAVYAADSSNYTLNDSGDIQAVENMDDEIANGQQNELVENEDYEIFVGDIASIEKMPKDAEGNVSISVDDVERYNQKVCVGGNAIYMDDLNLDYGIHAVTFKYGGDGKYAGFMRNATYENKYIDVVNISGRIADTGSLGSVSVALDEGITGHVRVLLDDEVCFDEEYGSTSQGDIYSDDGLRIWFEGYRSTYEVQYFNGNQKDMTLKGKVPWDIVCSYPEEVRYGEDVKFKIQLSNGSYGIAKFKNATYPFKYVEGDDSEVIIFDLDLGKNTVEFTIHVGNDTISQIHSVTVSPFFVPEKLYVGEPQNLIFNASKEFDGELILSGMVNSTFNITNGSASIPVSSQNPGYNMLYLTYGNYTWNYEIEVVDHLQLDIYAPNSVYPWTWADSDGDSGPGVDVWLLSGDVKHNITGNTTIYLNDKPISQHQGEFHYLIDEETLWQSYEESGNYTVKAVYSGDGYYEPKTTYFTFYLSSHDITVSGNNLKIRLPCQSSGILTVKAGNETIYKEIAGDYEQYPGYAEHQFEINETDHPIVVSFNATDDIWSFNETVSAGESEIFDYPTIMDYGENAEFRINKKSDSTLVLYINGYNAGNRLPVFEIDLNRNSSFTIDKEFIDNILKSKLAIKEIMESGQSWGDKSLILYPVHYSENGSSDLDPISIYFKAKVTGADNIEMYRGDSKTISLNVYDIFANSVDENETVEISIGDNTYTPKTDKNGAINFKIPAKITQGVYFLRISYKDFFTEKILNVFNAKIAGAKSISMFYGDSKTVDLKVYGLYGDSVGENESVKILIGKIVFSPKTDRNGEIHFKIPAAIAPGSYSMKISYKDFSIKKTLNVKHVLTLKKVKVKKSAKKLVLSATLKKGKTLLKNKKVTFKFNGKKYTAKTNKKGVVKVTVKKSVLKKLKVGKKVTYRATYLKDTVKRSVKVKK